MKANELRIGNWVQDYYLEKPYQVNSKEIFRFEQIIDEGKFQTTNYTSIPLTEEWLKKFGFKKPFDYWEFHKGKIFFDIAIKDGKYYYIFDCNYRVGQYINSVHCLQNLFFALTGEELEIKEEL